MKSKIFLLLGIIGLLPLIAASALFYIYSRNVMLQDRMEIYLEHISRQNTDKIDLFLTERQEEVAALSMNELARRFLNGEDVKINSIVSLLNESVKSDQVYDLMMIIDTNGEIRAINNINRFGEWFDTRIVNSVLGTQINRFPPEAKCWTRSLTNGRAFQGWYRSNLVDMFYNFDDDDISRWYHITFAHNIVDQKSGRVVGVWECILNWEYIQAILDLVENDFYGFNLPSGYALMLDKNGKTVMAAPFRKNRRSSTVGLNMIGMDITKGGTIDNLYDEIVKGYTLVRFFLRGERYGAVSKVGFNSLGWNVIISLSEKDIFAPVRKMGLIFLVVILVGGVMVVIGALVSSRKLLMPLAELEYSAKKMSAGDYLHRVKVKGNDEIAVLAMAFNTMSEAIEERQRKLEDLNKDLEERVKKRTNALNKRNKELKNALKALNETRDQLVQSEKMASLGQLVAGVAHEIKNPLNFIYGNTSFLSDYAKEIEEYLRYIIVHAHDEDFSDEIDLYRKEHNIDFILKDIGCLANNIHEGAERIKTIIDDLRTFSRAPSGKLVEVDLPKILDMCLNLLRNQYKGRIKIHRDYNFVASFKAYLGRLEQVFLNLLNNAIQAIDGDGEIWIRTYPKDNMAVVEIEDSGPGIPNDNLSKVFEPFFTTKEVGEGTGLGLSISYNIVRQHGGNITTFNSKRGGAVFRVELPFGLKQ